jgi:hypothetical protein
MGLRPSRSDNSDGGRGGTFAIAPGVLEPSSRFGVASRNVLDYVMPDRRNVMASW